MEKTFVKVQQLRVVLEKKRDPVTQESLLDQIKEVNTERGRWCEPVRGWGEPVRGWGDTVVLYK